MASGTKFITVIMPCREEENYIGRALASILANDYPQDCLEVLVVDGMSTDGSRKIIAGFARDYLFVKLLDNPQKITPAALNIGIAQAKGDIIIRVDAHSTYPSDYLSSLVAWQEKTGADNVGGRWRILPGSDTPMARAIAVGLAHPFGAGKAYYRIGTSVPRWVDTVPFGCYRREIFEQVGTFDKDLVRNQDEEFNLRLRKYGGRTLLVPDIVVDYHARESLPKLRRTYYQFGYFKPLVARKLGFVLEPRQIAPSLMVLALAVSLLLGCWLPILGGLGLAALAAYVLADVFFSLGAGRQQGLAVIICLFLVFPTLHFSYGLGFLKGLMDFLVLGKTGGKDGQDVLLSR